MTIQDTPKRSATMRRHIVYTVHKNLAEAVDSVHIGK
jgi:hypothetical protein